MGTYAVAGSASVDAVESFGSVHTSDLLAQLEDIRDSLAPIMKQGAGGLGLSSVEVGLTMDAKGKIAFIAEASVGASITLTFSRPAEGA